MPLKKVSKKEKSSANPKINAEQLGKLAKEYADLSAQIKVLDSRKKELSEIIKKGAVDFGTKDDKGSSYLSSGGYIMGNVASVSLSLDQDRGVTMLEARGLGDLVDVQIVKTINEDKLKKAVSDKRISVSDVEQFTNKKVAYKVSVKKEEEIPEIEQSTLKSAARRR